MSALNIKIAGIELTIPESKIKALNTFISGRVKEILKTKKRGYSSISFEELEKFLVKVKISDKTKISTFKSLDYSYYLESYKFNKERVGYDDYLAIDNCITLDWGETTDEFKPWNGENMVWKLRKEYGIPAFYSSNISYGREVYVHKDYLAALLIIDASIHKAAFDKKKFADIKFKLKLDKAVDSLLTKFDITEEQLISYIENR